MCLPSGRITRVRSISTFDGELEYAYPPMSVTLCLEDEVDISRGDMLVPPSHAPHVLRSVDARLVWMHDTPLEAGREYLLKHTSRTVRAVARSIRYRMDINTLDKERVTELRLNDLGAAVIDTQQPLFCDPYRRNHGTGSFILIDPRTNATVGAGMITGREAGVAAHRSTEAVAPPPPLAVSREEQEARSGHRAVTVWIKAPAEAACRLHRLLFDEGMRVHLVEAGPHAAAVAQALNQAGVTAVVSGGPGDIAQGADDIVIESGAPNTATQAHALMKERGLLIRQPSASE
jgi:hypothetical protein